MRGSDIPRDPFDLYSTIRGISVVGALAVVADGGHVDVPARAFPVALPVGGLVAFKCFASDVHEFVA